MSESESQGATVSPSDAVTEEEIGEAAAGESESSISVTDMLLSTEPEETPDQYPDVEPRIAHGIIGVKKMLRGAGAPVKSGVPALQNFAMAGIGFLFAGDDAEDDQEGAEAPTDNPDEGLYEPDREPER